MSPLALRFRCPHTGALMMSDATCRQRKAGRISDDAKQLIPGLESVGLAPCRDCPGPEPLPQEVAVTDTPTCRNHPNRPAVIRRDGRSAGLCKDCLAARLRQNSSGPRTPYQRPSPAQLRRLFHGLRQRAEAVEQAIRNDDPRLSQEAQTLVIHLQVLAQLGALPGWGD